MHIYELQPPGSGPGSPQKCGPLRSSVEPVVKMRTFTELRGARSENADLHGVEICTGLILPARARPLPHVPCPRPPRKDLEFLTRGPPARAIVRPPRPQKNPRCSVVAVTSPWLGGLNAVRWRRI